MMKRISKIVGWGLGLFLLLYLILSPIEKSEQAWGTWSLPLSGQTIVIDPAQGGPDGGAEGADGTHEKGISLEVAKKLRDRVQQSGAMAYLTRQEDKDLADADTKGLSKRKSEDIRKRLQFIHDKEADFFVTIHLNAIPYPRWYGALKFYYPKFPACKHLSK